MAERERESDSKGVVNTGDALVVQESIAHSRMQNTYYSFYYRLNFFTFCYNWSCIVAHIICCTLFTKEYCSIKLFEFTKLMHICGTCPPQPSPTTTQIHMRVHIYTLSHTRSDYNLCMNFILIWQRKIPSFMFVSVMETACLCREKSPSAIHRDSLDGNSRQLNKQTDRASRQHEI